MDSKQNMILITEELLFELLDRVVEHLEQTHIFENEKEWLTGPDVLKMLSISKGTLQKLRDNGSIEFSQIGRLIFYKRSSIQAFLEENTRSTF